MIFLDSLLAMSDGLMNFSSPVDLTGTNHHLTRPLPHPLNARVHCIGLHVVICTYITCTCIHVVTCRLSLTSLAFCVTSLTDMIMVSWTWSNHFSTAPRAADVEMVLENSTFSPSLLNIATISRFSVNSSLERKWRKCMLHVKVHMHELTCRCLQSTF